MSWDYVIKRFLLFLAVIFVAVTINFIIPRLRDTNPIEERLYQLAAQGGVNVSKIKELTAIYEAKYGLDKSIGEQYLNYWNDIFHLDFGWTIADRTPVINEIMRAVPWTIGLLTVATFIAFIVGTIFGALLAWPKTGNFVKYFVPLLMTLSAIPYYLLGIVFIYLFAINWGVLPTAGARKPLVEVTLRPGSSVSPSWQFPELVNPNSISTLNPATKNSRSRLAAFVTSPENERFPKVIVNRLWKRYFGAGLVESADDWHNLNPSHPELLDYLGRELVKHNYDLKHIARLLLNSHAYQREVNEDSTSSSSSVTPYFAAQQRRRLSAEQIVDGLYHAAGLPMEVGELNMDRDGGNGPKAFLNLGYPRKAWQYASLSNERDRPSLAFPRLQAIIDTLMQFGWRPSRQEPLSDREATSHPLQPGILSNGVFATWLTRLSEEHAITRACIEAKSPEVLLETIFLRFLTRQPTQAEQAQFLPLIQEGFESRIIPIQQRVPIPWPKKIPAVSWSNHLSPEANSIMLELEQRAREGEPASNALETNWRERTEDVLWALINTPELLFVP